MAYPTPTGRWQLQESAPDNFVAGLQGGDARMSFGNTSVLASTGPGGTIPNSFDFAIDNRYVLSLAGGIINGGNVLSATAWIYMPALPTGNSPIVSEYDNNTNSWRLIVRSDGALSTTIQGTDTTKITQSTTTILPLNQWVHVGFTYTGATQTQVFYIDGVPESPASGTPPVDIIPAPVTPVWVGRDQLTAFHAKIADATIWKQVITEADVNDIMAEGVLTPPTNFLAKPGGTGNIQLTWKDPI